MSKKIEQETRPIKELTPQHIVKELDRYIVGQHEAKRVVAVALRNRFRRLALPAEMQAEITPKNILMIGPTGVGKTEIARRLAKLAGAPFIKVEATKFTQVGYVGRDAESIIRDLMDVAIGMVHDERIQDVRERAAQVAEERILDILTEKVAAEQQTALPAAARSAAANGKSKSKTAVITASGAATATASAPVAALAPVASRRRKQQVRKMVAERLARNELDEQIIEIELEPEESYNSVFEFVAGMATEDLGDGFQEFLSSDRSGWRAMNWMSRSLRSNSNQRKATTQFLNSSLAWQLKTWATAFRSSSVRCRTRAAAAARSR